MKSILVVYESRTGHTAAMADEVAAGVREAGLEAKILPVERAKVEDLLASDGIIAGSFTSYGLVAGKLKELFDESAAIHGKLQDKVGGAFASAGGFGGGAETAVLSILQMLLVHGMIVPGDRKTPHFGAVAAGAPDGESRAACRRLGSRVAALAARLAP